MPSGDNIYRRPVYEDNILRNALAACKTDAERQEVVDRHITTRWAAGFPMDQISEDLVANGFPQYTAPVLSEIVRHKRPQEVNTTAEGDGDEQV